MRVMPDLGFLERMPHEIAALVAITVEEKLEAFDLAANYLLSLRGRDTRDALLAALAEAGYGDKSARQELDAMIGFLSRRHLAALVDNPAVMPGGRALLDGQFVTLHAGVQITGMPVGPVLVVGSGNSFVPSVIASVLALLANCPVALRGATINQAILEQLFAALRTAGSRTLTMLLEHVHLFFLDHSDPEQGAMLRTVLRTGPFGAANFWGGRAAIDSLVAELGHNPRHPVAIPMEPMTGVAVITERFVQRHPGAAEDAAEDLADAITDLGQQMCSSPTEAYFVGSRAAGEAFAREVAIALERNGALRKRRVSDRAAMLIDRIREHVAGTRRTVIAPRDGDVRWTLLVGESQSAFVDADPPPTLGIHERTAFLEIVCVPDLETVVDRMRALPSAPCHHGIKQVQTLTYVAHLDDAQRVIQLLRRTGNGVFRAVTPKYVMHRHFAEPLDGQHLLALFTRQVVVV
jgi:hypothetical protein